LFDVMGRINDKETIRRNVVKRERRDDDLMRVVLLVWELP